ncbi:hypothetical protein CXP39_00065 [Mesoplasma syrphidae]|uniref:PTS system, beta-glucoside-specific IIABC component n=1 Tax=Mesoplasma syrphidae TaxID=225999 RepID=A0A2K9BIU4_9MOLU|nr:PTS glucose transporter subunit IIA [Mesoplasma syrphidae]AUF83206.1 hypothetical protein CXP39_00065 [Mesoplasma syrphidae]
MKNSIIKIYAPVNGEIGLIKDLNDGVFSEKMLGDGFYITSNQSENATFYSPIEKGSLSLVTETKHAYFFEVSDGISILMHIGLDTVALGGKPFKQIINVNDVVTNKTEVVNVDIKSIINANLNVACPVTINSEKGDYKFNLLNESKNVKQGDLIGEFILLSEKEVIKDVVPKSPTAFFLRKNKYETAAEEINKFVGGSSNYDEVYNCMTRLRFKIKNKKKVNIDAITSLSLSKGAIWNGDELQVIIGQDVYNVKNAVDLDNKQKSQSEIEFNLEAKQKLPPFKAFLAMFGGIMTIVIPAMVGAGIIQAIIGILTLTEVMPSFAINSGTIGQILALKGADVWWFLLFSIGKTAGMFIGITIAYSASKYFKLRGAIAVPLGVILCSPLLFAGGGALGLGGEWVILSLGNVDNVADPQLKLILNRLLNISITPGNIKIFVIIAAIFVAKKLDDWIITWVHPMLELMTRPFLVILLSSFFALGLFTPVWNFFEGILSVIMFYIGKAPLGIGLGVYTALWQVCVVLGMHLALGIVGMVQSMASAQSGLGGYGTFGLGGSISVYAQIGALVAIIIMTKNAQLKRQAISYVPVGLLGITEPIIYGINLPRRRPLIAGVIGAFIAGCFAGAFGVTQRIGTGIGLFEIIGYFQNTILDPTGSIAASTGQLSNVANGLLYILSCIVALGAGIGFGILLHEERKSEKKSMNALSKSIYKLIITANKASGVALSKNEMKNLKNELIEVSKVFTKEELIELKSVEDTIIKELKLKTKLDSLNDSEAKAKEKLMKNGKKAVNKGKMVKAEKLMCKYNAINNAQLRLNIENEIEKASQEINWKYISEFNNKLTKEIYKLLQKIQSKYEKNMKNTLNIDQLKPNIENVVNLLSISYNIEKPKPEFNISKEILKNQNLLKQVKI